MQSRNLDISTGASAKTKHWKNKTISWSALIDRFRVPIRTSETYREYMAMHKDDQSAIKDVGGFVGGILKGGQRSPSNVIHRSLLALDIDFADKYIFEDFNMIFGAAALIHGSHKHSEDSPRYRLIIPLAEDVDAVKYEAISRKIAGTLGIEKFDNTTFQPSRLMFWPSVSKDANYYFEVAEGPLLNPDDILSRYHDYTDMSQWPTAKKVDDEMSRAIKKQADPLAKEGAVGAFCRAYTIQDAIEKFLSDEYEEAVGGRYTYTLGSTSGGLAVYEDKFAYSHHNTDPAGQKLCNAFDLVRLHLFPRDNDKQSFADMESMVLADPACKKEMAEALRSRLEAEFADPLADVEPDLNWLEELDVDGKGKVKSNEKNYELIFDNDPVLCTLRTNEMSGRKHFKGVQMTDIHYAQIRQYVGKQYGISSVSKIEDIISITADKNRFHPVRDYLTGLKWDGVKRISDILPDYMGAENTNYTREVMRVTMIGGIKRVFIPGTKFDTAMVLAGAQGIGKSTFISKLATKTEWFTDSLATLTGKDSYQLLQGRWFVELSELSSSRHNEQEQVKQFLSACEDTFRKAYGRETEQYKRQNIFIGTTNDHEFLQDPTGARRFFPITCTKEKIKKFIWDVDDATVAQWWAEAMELYKSGSSVLLNSEAQESATRMQELATGRDENVGIIEQYINKLIPEDFESYGKEAIKMWHELGEEGTVERTEITNAEILAVLFPFANKHQIADIRKIMRNLQGWEKSKNSKTYTSYGNQRYYIRKASRGKVSEAVQRLSDFDI